MYHTIRWKMGSKLLSVTRDRNLTRSTPLLSQPKQPMAVMRILRVCTLLSLLCYSEAMFKRDVRTDFWARGTTEEKCVYKKGIAFQTWCEADIYVNLPISVSNFWKGLVSFAYPCIIDQGPSCEGGDTTPKLGLHDAKLFGGLGGVSWRRSFQTWASACIESGRYRPMLPPSEFGCNGQMLFCRGFCWWRKKVFFSPKGSYFVPWYCIEIIYEKFRTILSLGQFHSRTSIGDAVSKATSKAKSIVHRAEEAAEDFKDA